MTKKEIWLIIFGFVIWRLAIAGFAQFAPNLFDYAPGVNFAGQSQVQASLLPTALASTANFDGYYYLTIAEHSYHAAGLIQAFFPLYPLLIAILTVTQISPLAAGLIISNALALGFFLIFFAYLKKNFSLSVAWWAILAIALFPTSFYLGYLYTESLFLFLLVAALIFYQKKLWPALSAVLILLTATRIIGIILVIALLITYLWENLAPQANKSPKKLSRSEFWLPIIWITLGCLGLIGYMIYLAQQFGDPILFYHAQDSFGAERTSGQIILFPQVIWRYLKMFALLIQTQQVFNWKAYAYFQEFFWAVVGLIILLYQLIFHQSLQPLYQKFSWHYLSKKGHYKAPLALILFSLGALIMPTLTGNFSSVARYILVCLSLFIGFGQFPKTNLKIIWLVLSLIFLILNLLLFTQAYWIA